MRKKAILATLIVSAIGLAGILVSHQARPAPNHPYFEPDRIRVIAHRGGAGLWPENTLHALKNAYALGVDILEIDIRATQDMVPVLLHDNSVDRTTNGTGKVAEKTLEELEQLDAGYRWTMDEEHTFPFRSLGITIPTLEQVFQALPTARYNIELKGKQPELLEEVSRLIKEYGMSTRALCVSGSHASIKAFRLLSPDIATAASLREGLMLYLLGNLGIESIYSPEAFAFQIPEHLFGIRVLTPAVIAAAHARNCEIHLWTIDSTADMHRFIDAGVDGIITNYPDRLIEILSD
jgi:glycerophosphoryl diester phosphodiesterase